ncbi:MAG: hypothetical protein IKH26_05995 [Bacteroidaceae bacterium]|nr:hypothetical protein [Bacteroidaceae bacterium]
MGVVIIIVGIMLFIAHKNKRKKKEIGLPGMGSPIGNVSVMKGKNLWMVAYS